MSKILVIGDLIHDVIVIPDREIRPNTDTNAEIHKTMGGSASNVAAWLGHLGVDVTFVACVSGHEVESLSAELLEYSVKTKLQTSDRQTGSLVVLVQGESRSMLTDRGANADLRFDEIETDGFSIVYLSGYALLGKSEQEISSLIYRSKKSGALVAIDPGSTGFIQDFGVREFRNVVSLADLVFPNQEEEELLALSGSVPLTVITRGELGASLISEDGTAIEAQSPMVELVDPTGAGDAFCAGFLGKLVENERFSLSAADLVTSCLEAGVATGSLAVGRIGARP